MPTFREVVGATPSARTQKHARQLNSAELPAISHSDIAIDRFEIAMPDGVQLHTERWYPRTPGTGATVLIRTPYGLTDVGPEALAFAQRGHSVIVQECRGTFGSGGVEFEPFFHEAADGRATLAWIRAQPWATGPVHTFGSSYVGMTQWALCNEPGGPDSMTVCVSARDFPGTIFFEHGGLNLETLLVWSYALIRQELPLLRQLRDLPFALQRLARAARTRPIEDADMVVAGSLASGFRPYRDWVTHDPADAWWKPTRFAADLANVPPVTLVAGWGDLFLNGSFADYRALVDAGRPVRLIAGDWTHESAGVLAAAVRDTLLRLAGQDATLPAVRIEPSGGTGVRELDVWPPRHAEPLQLRLNAAGALEAAEGAAETRHYRFDPANPTPNAGGRSLNPFAAGRRSQRAREARADVLLFTSDPLDHDTVVIGQPQLTLAIESSNPGFDLFVRVCDVDPSGRSQTVADVYQRAPKSSNGMVALTVQPMAHRFAAGHRIRLQVSSGAHPLHAANTGSADPVRGPLQASEQTLRIGAGSGSSLELPVELSHESEARG